MQFAAILVSLFAVAWTVQAAPGLPEPCDTRLIQPATNPDGYRLRGDRCEGIYIQEVGGSPLFIASWTQSFADYQLESTEPLNIEWDIVPRAGEVRLRAQGLRRKLYYRMDAVRPARSRSFVWSSELLAGLRIRRSDVGVTGTVRAQVGDAERDVYLPLRIKQGGKPVASGGYQLVLLPGVELKEVFVTLISLAGTKPHTIRDAEPLGYGYYPAERALEIPVLGAAARGFYHLLVAATLRSGGATTVELWFYHAGV